MSQLPQNTPIIMVRPTLDQLPEAALPDGISASWYMPGDEQHWVNIQEQADRFIAVTLEHYTKSFGGDPAWRAERQLFLRAADGSFIGTASAWFDGDIPTNPVGRVHWVAIIPAYQGRGLAKPLLTTVCHRLHELGHTSAILDTSTGRVPAVNLYRQFGFQPQIDSPDALRAWQELAPSLKEPLELPA